MKEYFDEMWCPVCKKDTRQFIHDSEHERDSSNDWRICSGCCSRLDGWGKPTGKVKVTFTDAKVVYHGDS